MNFKDLRDKIKEEQKHLAQQIKRGKSLRKPKDRINVSEKDRALYYGLYGDSDGFTYWKVTDLGETYRHRHIIYCNMFFNTPYEMIEQSTRDDHKPSTYQLEKIQKEWESELDEDVRDCA